MIGEHGNPCNASSSVLLATNGTMSMNRVEMTKMGFTGLLK